MSYGVLIGRFQPLHLGHVNTIKEALTVFDNVVILIGSSNCPRSFHNPWTFAEREAMIREALPEYSSRIAIRPAYNHWDQEKWAKALPIAHDGCLDPHLISPAKDVGTAKYLQDIVTYNPGVYGSTWSPADPSFQLCSTDLRKVIFNPYYDDKTVKEGLRHFVTPEVITVILEWKHSKKDDWSRMCRELDYNSRYKTEVKNYPRNELTADLCLLDKRGEKVLMIKRGRPPGELLWAVPGGFVEQDETTLQAAYREFTEETQCVLDSSNHRVLDRVIFDIPDRSFRARIASMVTFAQLTVDSITPLPSIPETLAVEWKTPDALECFEDHFAIATKGLEIVRQSHS